MPFYTGKSADGSDAMEVEGVYINPNNPNEWSGNPYPQQIKEWRMYWQVRDYMNSRFTLRDVYDQIQAKTCQLPYSLREYVLSHFDNEGNFITDENETN